MKSKICRILLFALTHQCIVTFTGCIKDIGISKSSPCPPVLDIYSNIRSDDWAKFAYHLNDTIMLQYNGGGSTIYKFIQQNIDSGYSKFQTAKNNCPGDMQHWQYINYNYGCSLYQNPITVSQYISFADYTSIIFDKKEYKIGTASISWPYYSDKMNINGKTYVNIEKFTQGIYGDTNEYALYNTTEGVLQIISNGKTWYRLPQ